MCVQGALVDRTWSRGGWSYAICLGFPTGGPWPHCGLQKLLLQIPGERGGVDTPWGTRDTTLSAGPPLGPHLGEAQRLWTSSWAPVPAPVLWEGRLLVKSWLIQILQ